MNIPLFAQQFWKQYEALKPIVPVTLNLDHPQDFEIVKLATDCGFISVMIDASALPLNENIAEVKKVVDYAHQFDGSVEAELGRIGTADYIESDTDEELLTDPAEAETFVRETGVDPWRSRWVRHLVFTLSVSRALTRSGSRLSALARTLTWSWLSWRHCGANRG